MKWIRRIFFWLSAGLLAATCSLPTGRLFKRLSADRTGISFRNEVREDEAHNLFTYTNLYTGAGVAAGDINNDGLTDLYLSGNMTSGRLYLNQGNLTFEDITETAGVHTTRWGTGVSMADLNADGWTDIYVCVSGADTGARRANLLYINNHDNTFTESAARYGLADPRPTMHAAFFDYDRDGDLDVFMIVNPAALGKDVNRIGTRQLDGASPSTDVLYRNNGDNTFTDVSRQAGILAEGYSLGLAVSDLTADGWPDVYISNDFIGNDVLYVNNGDGTFTDRAAALLKHTSYAGMGNDVADINNDGLPDIVELDMRPEDNFRQKLILPATGYDRFRLALAHGYQPQHTRNTLQLNQGEGRFSEIGFLAGVSSTDWSWSALLADYDNDGDRDLFVTNGFYRDLGDLDYIRYQNTYNGTIGSARARMQEKLRAVKALQGVPLHNYLFENTGRLTFADRSADWGMAEEGFSNGAAYVDLDNDGDLELVVNNFNEEAHVYENRSRPGHNRHFLRIRLKGSRANPGGIGARVTLTAGGRTQFAEHFLSRGYESSVDPTLHFGLGAARQADRVAITWPDGKHQVLHDVKADRLLTIDYQAAADRPAETARQTPPLFTEVTGTCGTGYRHRENDFVDFKTQPLLPHMHSRSGPGLAVGDVNADGLDDFFVGGAAGAAGALFVQGHGGTFGRRPLPGMDTLAEQTGVLLFDADGDGDPDLYAAGGGSEHPKGSAHYQDQLYLNDGAGHFVRAPGALPDLRGSHSGVVAADYDRDGDLDLFVGGRVVPGAYPTVPRSALLRNDSGRDGCRFTDVTARVSPGLATAGMVTSALWSDYDNDGWADLVVAGEFMPLRFYRNQGGKLTEATEQTGLANTSGWWNSLTGGDFDADGDTDYLAGNLGLNARYRAGAAEPLCIYAGDYNKDGTLDAVMTHHLGGEQHLVHTRDELVDQMREMRARFRTYKDYAGATFEESFLPEELDSAYVVCSQRLESSYVENLGGGKFRIRPLPAEAQLAPVFGMLADDFDGDGHLDALLAGNSYATEATTGRYDASVGLLLRGDGKGGFLPVAARRSGFWADGDAKGMARLLRGDGRPLLLVSNNDGPLQAFEPTGTAAYYRPGPRDAYAEITLADGRTCRHEFYYGSTYLSQSARLLRYPANAVRVRVVDYRGNGRLPNNEQLTTHRHEN